jgi:hypothetical protein
MTALAWKAPAKPVEDRYAPPEERRGAALYQADADLEHEMALAHKIMDRDRAILSALATH